MKQFLIVLVIIIVAIIGYVAITGGGEQAGNGGEQATSTATTTAGVTVTPIEHASGVLRWDGQVIYMDPVGDAELYVNEPAPDVVLLTHAHPDHVSTSTLAAVTTDETQLVAPQTVYNELPADIADRTTVLANGDASSVNDLTVNAVPMYNLPESEDAYHVKGEGNGYVLEKNETRVYIAGDAADIPEMRSLENIDVAFVPMNQPYTMDVETAADAVVDFAPGAVYPYHYRNQDESLSDVERFRTFVNDENPDIDVILADWYPTQ